MKDEFYWACSLDNKPAKNRFVIANGQHELWPRVYVEITQDDRCAWNRVHPADRKPQIEDIMNLLICEVPTYQINQNKFLLEAAKIPVFAEYLHQSANLNYIISNPLFASQPIIQEAYDAEVSLKLAHIIEETIKSEPERL
jgi:hypothetical protein